MIRITGPSQTKIRRWNPKFFISSHHISREALRSSIHTVLLARDHSRLHTTSLRLSRSINCKMQMSKRVKIFSPASFGPGMLASGSKYTNNHGQKEILCLELGCIHTAIYRTTETVNSPQDQNSGKNSNVKYTINIPCWHCWRLNARA